MNLKHLADTILISETKRLVREEIEVTSVILHHIKEIERRKIFSDYGYPSMLSYAIKELSYSEGAAQRRLQASRLLKDLPEIEEKICDGTLSLSNLSQAAGFFKKEEIIDPKKKKEILGKLENKSAREGEKVLFDLGTKKVLPDEGVKIVSKDYQQIKVNVSDEIFKKITDVKELLGHHHLDELFFKSMAEEALQNITRKRFKLTDKGRVTHSDKRTPSNHDRRETYNNSDKVCEKCGGLFLLQEDHIRPYALGGSSRSSNLRLLCFHCNQRERIKAKL